MSKKQSESRLWFYATETEEHKAKRLANAKGRNKGRKHTQEEIEKIKAARKKQHQVFDEKARKHMSESQKKYWASLSKEERNRKVQRFINAGKSVVENTKIEQEIKRQLDELCIDYEQQKQCYNKKYGKNFYADFYLPKYDLIIECNGSYWHNLPDRKERDELFKYMVDNAKKSEKHKYLQILFLWDYEINENPNLLKERLPSILGSRCDF